MSSISVGNMESLCNDVFYDILRRLDGVTLASAACACATFSSISKEERIWENVCSSMWSSTGRDDVKALISSIGGFKKFYADCFPLIVNKEVPEFCFSHDLQYPEEWTEAEYYGDLSEVDHISPSDFVSLVDVTYKGQTICSKVLWGIPNADSFTGWFHNCPFRIDLLSDSPGDHEVVTLSASNGLPHVTSMERERKDGKLWHDLRESIHLSWILVNKKNKQAANLSSWSCLGGQPLWPTDKDFFMRFGSVLPAKDILPCQFVECILTMRFRVVEKSEAEGADLPTSLKLTELSMQVGDMEGAHVNGRNSLLVLKDGLNCRRSRNYNEALESCLLYSKVRNELKEEKMRNENRIDRMFIFGGITACITFCYYLM